MVIWIHSSQSCECIVPVSSNVCKGENIYIKFPNGCSLGTHTSVGQQCEQVVENIGQQNIQCRYDQEHKLSRHKILNQSNVKFQAKCTRAQVYLDFVYRFLGGAPRCFRLEPCLVGQCSHVLPAPIFRQLHGVRQYVFGWQRIFACLASYWTWTSSTGRSNIGRQVVDQFVLFCKRVLSWLNWIQVLIECIVLKGVAQFVLIVVGILLCKCVRQLLVIARTVEHGRQFTFEWVVYGRTII